MIIDRGRVGSFGVPGRRMYVVGSPARTGLAGRAVDLPICLRGDAFACWVSSVTGPNANPSKRRSRKLTGSVVVVSIWGLNGPSGCGAGEATTATTIVDCLSQRAA